jgi:hypothetical protein
MSILDSVNVEFDCQLSVSQVQVPAITSALAALANGDIGLEFERPAADFQNCYFVQMDSSRDIADTVGSDVKFMCDPAADTATALNTGTSATATARIRGAIPPLNACGSTRGNVRGIGGNDDPIVGSTGAGSTLRTVKGCPRVDNTVQTSLEGALNEASHEAANPTTTSQAGVTMGEDILRRWLEDQSAGATAATDIYSNEDALLTETQTTFDGILNTAYRNWHATTEAGNETVTDEEEPGTAASTDTSSASPSYAILSALLHGTESNKQRLYQRLEDDRTGAAGTSGLTAFSSGTNAAPNADGSKWTSLPYPIADDTMKINITLIPENGDGVAYDNLGANVINQRVYSFMTTFTEN